MISYIEFGFIKEKDCGVFLIGKKYRTVVLKIEGPGMDLKIKEKGIRGKGRSHSNKYDERFSVQVAVN